MTRIPPFSLAGLVAAGLLIAGPALAQGMGETDTNADGQIDQSELRQSLSTAIGEMDTDGDGNVSQSEFEAATGGAITFSDIDQDGDGMVGEQELSQAIFDRYDRNADQRFDEGEYALYEQEFSPDFAATGAAAEEAGTASGSDAAATTTTASGEAIETTSGDGSAAEDYDAESSAGMSGTEATGDDLAASDDATTSDLTTSGETGGGEMSDGSGSEASVVGEADAATTNPLAGIGAEELMGAPVVGADGEEIAEVSDLVIGADGEVSDVVIDYGGFLGIGARSVALPAANLELAQGEDGGMMLVTPYSEPEIDQLGDYEDVEGDEFRLYSAEEAATEE